VLAASAANAGSAALALVAVVLVGDHGRWPASAAVACATVFACAALVGLVCWVRHARRLEAAAHRAHRLLTVFERVEDGVAWEIAPDGTITAISPAVTQLSGHDPGELIGRNFNELMPASERQRAADLLVLASISGQGWSDEPFVYLRADGSAARLLSSGVAHVGAGGRVERFSGALRLATTEDDGCCDQQTMQARIDRVITERLLHTVFQPIVDLVSGAVVGVEALTRFDHEPTRTPDVWFAEANATARGVELELLAVETALTTAATLPGDVYVSINVSPAAIANSDLATIVDRCGFDPTRLVVEVTEHVQVSDYRPVSAGLEALRNRGTRVAVDDAGAGYSSLTHVLRLQPHFIKLDRSLIEAINIDQRRRALVAAVNAFALEVGANVIAEGVETAEELDTLTSLNLRYGQGYLFGEPSTSGIWAAIGPSHRPDGVRTDQSA
jgi:PAS domain S-box-containing protein